MELRDIEIFLTLADELHFGRTAERLNVSQARVSQAIAKQERRMGTALFERTSRQVALTPVGARLRDDLRQGYELIQSGLAAASRHRQEPEGGVTVATMGAIGYEMRPVVEEFVRRHPSCTVEPREFHFSDPFGRLRRGEVDVQVTWLPVEEPDVRVGPRVLTEGRVLAMSSNHPLACESGVSVEVLADEPVFDVGAGVPSYWEQAMLPRRTPSGRPVRRGRPVRTFHEILTRVAAGEGVTPLNAHVRSYYTMPGVAYVPIIDVPDTEWVLTWLVDRESPEIRAFAETARACGTRAL
ncbi:LysR family transcriptional regulator [Mumia quercus]|uniref:LysR family transcriptional regulator n=1 Tax=Mumia quercus TaxID=2976125 RepID=UPI0021D2E54C|nr:LysR family transcriptional regulator [Mumia quercus]